MDKDIIRKRMSQIELEIDEMNQVLDKNLQLTDNVPKEGVDADTTKAVPSEHTNEQSILQQDTEPKQKVEGAVGGDDQQQKYKNVGTDVVASTSEVPQEHVTPPEQGTQQFERTPEPDHASQPRTTLDSAVGSTITPLALPKTRDAPDASKRSASNPFRVVSVSNNKQEVSSTQKLQNRHDYLTSKCAKLQREIKYLGGLRERGVLTPEDARKLDKALQRLQEYLDRKTKERYELGVLLSRQLRREIDRGENGQFWVGQ